MSPPLLRPGWVEHLPARRNRLHTVPRPQEELLERLVIAVRDLANDPRRDERHLDRVRFDPPIRIESVALSASIKLDILRRDSFTCRYCGIRTVFLPVLRALSAMFPDPFPVDDGWTLQGTHPAYNLLSATYDHVVSPTQGGESDPGNLVTACWPCNSGKSNYTVEEIGFELLPPSDSDWDGLTGVYPELCKSLSVEDRVYHVPWLKAISSGGPGKYKQIQ